MNQLLLVHHSPDEVAYGSGFVVHPVPDNSCDVDFPLDSVVDGVVLDQLVSVYHSSDKLAFDPVPVVHPVSVRFVVVDLPLELLD